MYSGHYVLLKVHFLPLAVNENLNVSEMLVMLVCLRTIQKFRYVLG